MMLVAAVRCLEGEYVPANQDDRPGELHSDWNTVRSGVVAVFGGVVHDGSQ